MEHHDELLDRLWDDGMNNYGTAEGKRKVAFAIQKTGLAAKQVKRWIDNRRRKHHRKDSQQRVAPLRRRKQSGFNIFMKQHICSKGGSVTKGEKMKTGAEEWRGLNDEGRKSYQDKAKEHHSQELVKSKLGQSGFSSFTRKLGSEVSNMCGQVEELEWVLVCSSAELGTSAVYGSTVGVNLATSTNFAAKLCAASGHDGGHVYKSTADESIKLRNQVQQIFNKKYSIATQKQAKMSYQLLEAGQIHCLGMPAGITLKRPSTYGRDVLKKIIAAEAELKFTVSTQASAPSTSGSTEAISDSTSVSAQASTSSASTSGSTEAISDNTSVSAQASTSSAPTSGSTAAIGDNTSGDMAVAVNDQQAEVDVLSITEIETPQDIADLQTMVKPNRDSDVYAVEFLTGKKKTAGRTYYQVKWEGFEGQTWEPAANIPARLRAEFNKK